MEKLLIKLPSRERPGVLLKAARLYADNCADKANTTLLLSLDKDDHRMQGDVLFSLHALDLKVLTVFGERSTKIGAVNRDLLPSMEWDILLVASDDMWPVEHGYDDAIRRDMVANFPAMDGCLWYSDGRQDKHCTMPVMGRRYYDRYGYVYEPGYEAYHCDVEQTKVAVRDGRMAKLDRCIIQHEHPCFQGKVADDDLYRHNRKSKLHDRAHYLNRQSAGFP